MGQDYPFFIGSYSNSSASGYFVNCFYNYTLRTVFLDGTSLSALGNIYSFQTEEGISSLIQKSGTLFGLTSYYEGNNYIMAGTDIDVLSSSNVKDMPAEPLYELTYRAAAMALQLNTDAEDYTMFASQTNDNSLVVYQYALESDSLINTHTRDFDEGIEVRDIIQTGGPGHCHPGRYLYPGQIQASAIDQDAPETVCSGGRLAIFYSFCYSFRKLLWILFPLWIICRWYIPSFRSDTSSSVILGPNIPSRLTDLSFRPALSMTWRLTLL